MQAVQVNFTVYGDVEENGTTYSCFAVTPLSVSAVESLFPFEGKYHFRIKQSGEEYGMNNVEYVWVDLSSGGDRVLQSYSEGTILDVQALVLDHSHTDYSSAQHDEGYSTYLQQVENVLQGSGLGAEDRPIRQTPQRSASTTAAAAAVKRASVTLQGITQGVQNISLESVTKGAASFWNNVKSTASQALGVTAASESASIANISLLHTELMTTFSDSNQRHQLLLSELWSALFPGEPFQRQAAKWKEAGFQRPDPVADVKNSGLLALRCMSYLGSRYPADTQRMIATQKENIKSHYPFAVVAVNLTLMLCDIVGIRDKR